MGAAAAITREGAGAPLRVGGVNRRGAEDALAEDGAGAAGADGASPPSSFCCCSRSYCSFVMILVVLAVDVFVVTLPVPASRMVTVVTVVVIMVVFLSSRFVCTQKGHRYKIERQKLISIACVVAAQNVMIQCSLQTSTRGMR